MSTLSQETAHDWITRWDRQQEGYLPDREERFAVIADTVATGLDRPDPLILDLGCGPGSLASRLLRRLPDATVIAVDTNPLLLALGRAAYGQLPNLRFVDLDLGTTGWAATLGTVGPFDAAVSTTALHWLSPPQLTSMYGEVASLLRPGGLLLNGDHFTVDDTPTLMRLEQRQADSLRRRRFGDDLPENWGEWWDAVLADPVLSAFADERAGSHDSSESGRLDTHVNALYDAGFGEVGTIWQHGDNRVLCGVVS